MNVKQLKERIGPLDDDLEIMVRIRGAAFEVHETTVVELDKAPFAFAIDCDPGETTHAKEAENPD